jgi:hypothetical protein
MAMADENLVRQDLADGEKAYFFAIRKDAYERLHPETKNGGDRGNQYVGGKVADRQNGELPHEKTAERLTAATAKVAGVG